MVSVYVGLRILLLAQNNDSTTNGFKKMDFYSVQYSPLKKKNDTYVVHRVIKKKWAVAIIETTWWRVLM